MRVMQTFVVFTGKSVYLENYKDCVCVEQKRDTSMIVCLSVRTLIYANSITNTPLDSFLEKFEKELKRYGSQMKLEREIKGYGSPMTINPFSLNKDHRNY